MQENTTDIRLWIGIDVSKLTLDVCVLTHDDKKRHKRLANTPAGFAQLLAWVLSQAQQMPCHFALEITGAYSEGIALFLAHKGQRVSLVNPLRVRYAALAAGIAGKTDKLDAAVIALYCRQHNPALWQMPEPKYRTLAALVRRREALLEARLQETNRLEQPYLDKAVQASLKRQVRSLEKEIARIEKALCQHIECHPDLARDAKLLQSIPGISTLTAQKILAELGDARSYASASSAAAYAGLSPQPHESGTSVRRKSKLSKRGNGHLRKAMYFPTVTALSWNPRIKAFYERLVAAGKPKMVALAAAMRKLLVIAAGVLRSGKPFDAHWPEPNQSTLSESAPPASLCIT